MADDASASSEEKGAPAAASATPSGGEVLDIDSDLEEVSMKLEIDIGDELADEDTGNGADDPERLPKEAQAYPPLHNLEEKEPEGRKAKVFAKHQEEAAKALKAGNLAKAVDEYTEGMRLGGATPVLLAHRAALLLKQKRPCAAIRDCSAAIKVNPHILQAYRLRGIAHRKLGHWKKAHRDLSEAQNLNWDSGTAEVHKFVTEKLGLGGGTRPTPRKENRRAAAALQTPQASKPSGPPPAIIAEGPYSKPVEPQKELDKDQAVFICGLQKAPHLNGRRGVVHRADPRPAQRGRWEVEVRLDGGRVELKSLKGENVMTLNKADKIACRAWMREEKKHLEEVKKHEQKEEAQWAQKRFEAKLAKFPLGEQVKRLLRQLKPDVALELLDKAEDPKVKNASSFLTNQARIKLGVPDSSSDEEGDDEPESDDPDRLPEDKPPFPVVPYSPESAPSDAQIKATNQAKQQAQKALRRKDLPAALKWYTDAVNAGGAASLMLAKRGEVLLEMKRPKAAISDCTAALEVNPDCGKAYVVRGIAHRKLGHWEEANEDLSTGQTLDFHEDAVKVHNFVALKVNRLQERGIKRRRKGAG